MNAYLTAILLAAISNLVAIDAARAQTVEPNFTKLFFEHSPLFNMLCSSPEPIDPAWISEVVEREGEFEAIWLKESPALFSALFSEFSRGFSRKELTATLSVCPNRVSMSNPLILNVNRYLKSFMGERPVWPDHAFADLVFHEILHSWLEENLKLPSPLLRKYQEEHPVVRSHLHLIALQLFLYEKTGRKDLLDWIKDLYPQMSGPYPKAWEIVNKEGVAAFIQEIRKQ